MGFGQRLFQANDSPVVRVLTDHANSRGGRLKFSSAVHLMPKDKLMVIGAEVGDKPSLS